MAGSSPDFEEERNSPQKGFLRGDFFLVWSSGVAMSVSMLLRTLISTQWLYDTTGSAAELGLLGAVQLLQLPMALYGGSLADRLDRKKLMVWTQAVGSLLLLAVTILAASKALEPWHIFVVTGLSSMVNMLGASARPAMLPRVVSRNRLTQAVTVLNVSSQLATVAGPILFWWNLRRTGSCHVPWYQHRDQPRGERSCLSSSEPPVSRSRLTVRPPGDR